LNLEVDLLFFDTPSTYFERDEPDRAGEYGEPAFRVYGHSKDHRPDLPQVIIGLAVTREGSRSACGCGRATSTTCPSCKKSRTTCAAGGWGGS
jgi:hypothetical protein